VPSGQLPRLLFFHVHGDSQYIYGVPQENRLGEGRDRRLLAHRALAEVSRVRLLEELRSAGRALDANELAGRLGLHHNTVRAHLDVLQEAGLVSGVSERRGAPGRPRIVYRPVPEAGGVDDERAGYRLLANILASYMAASSPDPGPAAIEAGQAWGRYLVQRPAPFQHLGTEEAIARLCRLLAELGFAPEAVEDGGQRRILLHRCPFRELAVDHPEVTCAVHLGLIRGALAELGAPLEAVGLNAFVEPSLCVAHLAQRERAAAGTHG
jgi:predicted ArsR family transcriptional regulator